MFVQQVTQAGFGLQGAERPPLQPARHQILLQVLACGVCRTDLHIADGEFKPRHLPIVPGHEIVGRIVARGADADRWPLGTRVGVPWLAGSCGRCHYCQHGAENLCSDARFMGFDIDGGYASMVLANPEYCVEIPGLYGDAEAAPLLCAGIIGYRALQMSGEPRVLGLYGFGAAAHILCQVAAHQGREVYAFTRPGDVGAQRLAMDCGARWAGDSTAAAPTPLDAAILFAPVGALVPLALRSLRRGGSVVCAGIHMSDIPQFPYELLWGERIIRSVANLTRADAEQFMQLAGRAKIDTRIQTWPLQHANDALTALREGHVIGAGVLVPDADT